MRIGILVSLGLIWTSIAGAALAQDTSPTAVPTAVPVSATPTTSTSSPIITRTSTAVTRKLQPQSVTIALLDGMKLQGELTEVDQWTMKTSFGSTNLPLSTVAGMRMAQEGSAMTTVVL